jgi:hypothetical protein
MSDWIIFESLFVFAVWMQRKHRWVIFGQAMAGKYTVAGSVRAGSQAFQYSPSNDGTVQAAGSGSGGSSGSSGAGGYPPIPSISGGPLGQPGSGLNPINPNYVPPGQRSNG